MSARLVSLVLALLVFGPGPAAAAGGLGVVLLHDKGAAPEQLAKLAAALSGAGFQAVAPQMCWSGVRLLDKAYADCLTDVDAAIADLRKKGATEVVLGGAAQGAVFAIDYGATHAGLVGIIAIGPSADPPDPSRYPEFAASLKAAQAALKKRQGQVSASFTELVASQPVAITTTAAIYLSFHGPQSTIATIRAIKAKGLPKLGVPLLWIAGTNDPAQVSTRAVFAAAPENKLSAYVRVEADHAGTADASAGAVIAWLKSLG
ncbi:MAG: hypothetical protein P4M09_09735 [Devosia sp.]|nr:hypothetical protein [Devosia sp.]